MSNIPQKEEVQSLVLLIVEAFLASEEQELSFPNLACEYMEDVLLKLGWTDRDKFETNGWEVDYWNSFEKDGNILEISGTMYSGNLMIQKSVERTEE